MPEATRRPGPALELLRSASSVLVTSHASPDGDAIGSELAFAELCDRLGIAVTLFNRDPHPSSLAFLPGIERIRVGSELPAGFERDFQLAVALECPGLDRPALDGLDRLPLLNIDHHLANELYGTVNWVDEHAPAVGEMILTLAEAAEVQPSSAMATNLYVALVTDTGDFRYSNATPRAFRAACRLVELGAEPPAIAEALWSHVPARVVRLTAEVLATLELHAAGRLAVLSCDRAMLERAGARPEDTENLINSARAIDGVEVALLLKAFTDDGVRASLRSRGALDVRAVAASFGGGGHRNAAGCTIPGSLEKARAAALEALLPLVEA